MEIYNTLEDMYDSGKNKAKRTARNIGIGALGAVAGLSALVSSGNAYAGNMIIESVPDKAVVAKGGDITFKIYADSREISDKKIGASQWQIWQIPSYLQLTSASLPDGTNNSPGPSTNPEDFYFDFPMWDAYNRVDTSISGGLLNDNTRISAGGGVDGPQNRRGLLGIYNFHVDSGAVSGIQKGDLNVVSFYDTNSVKYWLPAHNLIIIENNYTIADAGNTDLDNDVDLVDLGALAGGYGMTSGATWQQGDFDGDGDVDLVDLGGLAGNYGLGVPGAPVNFQNDASKVGLEGMVSPEPATLGILGIGALSLMGRRKRK